MGIIEEKEVIKTEKKWSDSEMEEFDKELEPYKQDFISVKNNKQYRALLLGGEYKYLEDKKILKMGWRFRWDRVKTMSDLNFFVLKPKKYTEFTQKLKFYNQWSDFQKLGNFGIRIPKQI